MSNDCYQALFECKTTLMDAIYDHLMTVPNHRDDEISVNYITMPDSEDYEAHEITAVYIDDDILFVEYFPGLFCGKAKDPLELFTIDTIAEILSQLH